MPTNRHLKGETSTLRAFLEEQDAQLCSALTRMDEIERDLTALDSFEYRSAYPKDVVELQIRDKKVMVDGGAPSPAALAAQTYHVGRTANLIHAFRWTRRKAVSECLGTLRFSLDRGALLPALILARAVLEHIGTVELFCRDLSRLKRDGETPNAQGDWVLEVQNALIPRLFGTRVDWPEYVSSGLKGKRRSGYKAQEGYFDQEAKNLLNGIDVLDKAAKGARNAYEFLSEFGHPNYPCLQLGVTSVEVVKHRHGFRMMRKCYAADRVARVGAGEMHLLLRDVFDVLVATLEIFLKSDVMLAAVEDEVRKATKLWVRKAIPRWSAILRPADQCPCLSGRLIAGCCGK